MMAGICDTAHMCQVAHGVLVGLRTVFGFDLQIVRPPWDGRVILTHAVC